MNKFYVVFSSVLLMLAAGCNSSQPAVVNAAPKTAPATVKVDADIPDDYVASGPVVVENQVDVAAQRDGMVVKVFVDLGTPVRKGQLLAQLDDRQLKAEREAAEHKLDSIAADVKNWESELKVRETDAARSNAMMKANLITAAQVEHDRYRVTQTEYEVQREKSNELNEQSTVQALDIEMEKTRIVAPFDGVVARRYVRDGQRVSSGDRMFWVSAVSPLEVRFTVPEKRSLGLKAGVELTIAPEGDFTHSAKAKITRVSPVVDPASGTIEAVAQVTGDPGLLKPGMTASIRLPK